MDLNRIYNEDCRDVLSRMDAGSVDLILQDTPFGCTQNEWDIKPVLGEMWPMWLRVAKPTTPIIFFATQPFASELIMSNLKMFRYDLIWYKRLCSGFLNAKKMPLRNHEIILVFYKKHGLFNPQMSIAEKRKRVQGNRRATKNYGEFAHDNIYQFDNNGKAYPQSVIDITNSNGGSQFKEEKWHETQKPIDLIRYLILTYSNAGDLVFDGYSGSGTTAAACKMEGRNFICSEMDTKEGYYDRSVKRVNNIPAQLFVG